MFDRIKKDEWIIAIRRKENCLLSRSGGGFKIIPNSLRYWCADPFLLDIDNTTFLLFEMYDRLRGKGLIGYRVLKGGKYSKMRVLIDDKGHLSYPFIIKHNGNYYIMPESNSQKIVYCTKLECDGENLRIGDKHIVINGKFVDTTLLEYGDKKYFFTTDLSKGDNVSNLTIFDEKFETKMILTGEFDKSNARMGGNFILSDKDIYRVSQDCSKGYGTGLNFSKINIEGNNYSEQLISKITVSDISLDSNKKYDGIHTYNFNNDYEVIDLKKSKVINLVRILGFALVKMGILKN